MDPHRLPRHVVPTRYQIRLAPDLESAAYVGVETIHVTVMEGTDELALNAAELEVESARLESDDGQRLDCSLRLDEATERLHLRPAKRVDPGAWRLVLSFKGRLNDRLRGFYRSTYTDPAGAEHVMAATQFESTDARRAFPCWDEPDFKAVFSVTLETKAGLAVYSNTPQASQSTQGGKTVTTFADTMRMSTYLVAFAVGELEATSPIQVGRTPMRVITVPGKGRLTSFAADIGAHSLRHFERYFGLPYPAEKLDHLAIPDFASGAMENLGLITYREAALLVDPSTTSLEEQARVAETVAHEVSHMWFGDLVTMAWWNGLWLNEAFATMMGYAATDAWRPEWKVWEAFSVDRAAAYLTDGLHHTRPVEFPVQAPSDAEAMFDVLTYEKGGSVLRMLEQHIGPTVFRDGVRGYLRRHAYANAETDDLWRAIAEKAGGDVTLMMQGWVFQPGYPLIRVERKGRELVMRQARFTYLPADGRPPGTSAPEERWMVPVGVRLLSRGTKLETRRILMDRTEARLPAPADLEAAVVNAGGYGYYRVSYSPDLLGALLRRLNELEGVERFNLLNDAWALTLAGQMRAEEFLELTAHFRDETSPPVFTSLIAALRALGNVIDDDVRPAFAAFVRTRLGPAASRLGWDPAAGEDDLTRRLRGEVLSALGTLGDDSATQREAEKVYARAAAGQPLDGNLWPAVLSILAHIGGPERHAEILARYQTGADPQMQRRAYTSLPEFRAPDLIRRNLDLCLDGTLRVGDAPIVLTLMLLRPHSRELAWAFLKGHWPEMKEKYPEHLKRYLWAGITGLTRPEWEADVKRYIVQQKVDFGGKAMDQFLERQHIAVRLRAREAEALKKYFSKTL